MANNPPFTTEVYIRFCEVPRIHDFVEGSALPSAPVPVVYRSFGVSGMTTVLRAFPREPEKQPIRPGSWVYLLSDKETSNKLRLFKILHFHASGKFRYVDLKTPEAVPASGEDTSLFPLTFVVPVPWRMVRFCALLSPFPLPAEVVTALGDPTTNEHENSHARALARASWLHDPFTCDIVPVTKSVPLTPEQTKNYAAGKCDKIDMGERILYLVNPFVEAAQRIGAYNDAVERAVAAQIQAGRSKRYVLAKRIEAVVASDPKRKELVMPKLAQDIDRFESPIDELRWEAERCAEDVLRWCGHGWTASGWKWFGEFDMKKITFKAEGSRHVVYENELQPSQKASANWIAAAAYETKYGSPELKESIGTLRSLFYSRLDQTKAGRDFLKLQTDRCLGEEPSKEGEDDGLMGALASTMKPADIVMQSWDGIVQNLLPWIYMRRGDLTFATLADFIQHKTGVDIRSAEVMEDRAKIAGLRQQNRTEYDARMKQAKRLIPRDKRASQYYQRNADKALKAVQLLSRMAMFWEKLGEMQKKKDARSKAEAASSFLNALELGLDLVPKPIPKIKDWMEKLTQRSYYVRTESRVFVPKLKFLGSIACGIDLVLALQDLGRSQGGGASIGYAMNALGAALGLGGAVASETGVGVVVALIGMALQLAGEWVIEHTDELYKFLEKSPWGAEHKATSESPDEECQRLTVQLDKILYAYAWNPKYNPANGMHPVDLEIQPGRGWRFLPSDASMDIDLLLSQDTITPQRQQVNCTLSVDELIGATSLTIIVARLTEIEVVGPLHLSGQITLRLDKQGTRALPANVAWSSVSTPDYAPTRDGAGGSL